MCNDINTAHDMIPNTYCNDLRQNSTGTDRYNQHKNNSTLFWENIWLSEIPTKFPVYTMKNAKRNLADHFVMAGKGTKAVT